MNDELKTPTPTPGDVASSAIAILFRIERALVLGLGNEEKRESFMKHARYTALKGIKHLQRMGGLT